MNVSLLLESAGTLLCFIIMITITIKIGIYGWQLGHRLLPILAFSLVIIFIIGVILKTVELGFML